MDLSLPLRTVVPGVDADVLAVLAGTHAPLTGNRVALLAERSYSQVRAVLLRLQDHGLVTAERHGQAISYTLNRDHVLAEPVQKLAGAHTAVIRRVRHEVHGWSTPPVLVALFGSFARRDGDAASDIDLLIVHPHDGDEDTWEQRCHALAARVERSTGNSMHLVVLTEEELTSAMERGDALIESLRADAEVVFGDAPAWQSATVGRTIGAPSTSLPA